MTFSEMLDLSKNNRVSPLIAIFVFVRGVSNFRNFTELTSDVVQVLSSANTVAFRMFKVK